MVKYINKTRFNAINRQKIFMENKNTVDKQDKLDIKDKKLLFYLSQNSRISYTQLAKKIALSKNAVKYRITRLRNLGIISQFTSVINLGALRYYTFTMLLRFNEDIYKNKEIMDYFKKHDFADWVATLSGHWDVFAEFACTNIFGMSEIIEGIIEHFGDSLATYQVFLSNDTLRVEHLIGDFYKDLKINSVIPLEERRLEEFKADSVDKKILNLLGEDSSLNFLDIADKLKLSLDVVRYRIKNLLKEKVIIKFFPEINLMKLGYTEYLYILQLKNVSSDRFKEIKDYLKNNDNITYAFVDKNAYNIVFNCAFKESGGIDSLSRGLRERFSDILESQDYLIIKEQVLFNLLPRGLIDL